MLDNISLGRQNVGLEFNFLPYEVIMVPFAQAVYCIGLSAVLYEITVNTVIDNKSSKIDSIAKQLKISGDVFEKYDQEIQKSQNPYEKTRKEEVKKNYIAQDDAVSIEGIKVSLEAATAYKDILESSLRKTQNHSFLYRLGQINKRRV